MKDKELKERILKAADLFVKNVYPYIKKLAKNDTKIVKKL